LASQNDVPHDVQIRNLAGRLTRKYQRGTPVQQVNEDGVAKRANTYSIMSAATPSQTNSAGIDQDGTDFSYFAQVYLGTKSTPYNMLLDSGAGQTWVMGSTCTSGPCKLHNTFGPSDSTTYKPVSDVFTIGYGTGQVSGLQATDTLDIAGLKLSMTFGIANQTSDDFNNFPIDGIIGLNRVESDYPNFVDSLVSSKVLKSNIFGISINRAKDGTNTGEINFGQPDTSRFSGSLSYTPVSSNSEKDWALPMDNLGVGTKQSGITGTLGYIDTGTSFIFCPPADAKTFHSLIPGSSSTDGITYYVPCTTTDSAFFTFSDVTYQVSSKDWVGPMVNGQCTSNIYGTPVVAGAWLLGDTFLKNVYIVFDVDQNRVGRWTLISVSWSTINLETGLAENGPSSSSVTSATTSSSGGPSSLSTPSSTALPSSSASAGGSTSSGVTSTTMETESNISPTGSSSTGTSVSASSTAASTTGTASTSKPTGPGGLNGHQTSANTAVAESSPAASSATPVTTQKSNAARLDTDLFAALVLSLTILRFVT